MDGGKSFLTPNQFEAACGRASSKDWRGSIKFGSRSLKKLIKEKVLIQHSSVCGCLICMDCSVDDKSRPPPPVRLFTPYKKRRAKDTLNHLDKVPKKVVGTGGITSLNGIPLPAQGATYISDINQALGSSSVGTIVSAGGEQVFVLSVPTATTSQIETASLPTPLESIGPNPSSIVLPDRKVLTYSHQLPSLGTAKVLTYSPQPPSLGPNPSSIEAALKQSTEDTFKHLEDIANNLITKAVELKQLIAEAKEKTLIEIQSLGKKDERIDLIDVTSPTIQPFS